MKVRGSGQFVVGIGETNSNSRQGCFHFTLINALEKEQESIY